MRELRLVRFEVQHETQLMRRFVSESEVTYFLLSELKMSDLPQYYVIDNRTGDMFPGEFWLACWLMQQAESPDSSAS